MGRRPAEAQRVIDGDTIDLNGTRWRLWGIDAPETHPPRCEYVPTQRGRDFRPVLLSLMAFGNKHFAPEGASVLLADRDTGTVADPVMVDRVSGRALPGPGFSLIPGPAAGERIRQRLTRTAELAASRKPGVLYE